MVQGFSGFGFPKAHGAAFGLLAYQSTWLRVHYGPEFLCALLNEQPMGFYPPDALVHEAQRRGIEVLRRRTSTAARRECESPIAADRLAGRCGSGSATCSGVREEEIEALVAERERGGDVPGVAELASRAGGGAAGAGTAGLRRGARRDAARRAANGGGRCGRLGVTGQRPRRHQAARQLALPIEPPAPPEL